MYGTTPECIDEEINKYLVLVSDLRAQKNSFLPIFRLPPETLANVFTHAASDYHEGNDPLAFCVPHWVNVSYVCRHWRNVALNCPTLWTYHFTVSLRWTKELLARSKQASLKIRIKYDYDEAESWWSRLCEEVLSHAGRIQELRLDVPANVLRTELSLNAPRLQILDIYFRRCASKRTFMINNGHSLPLRTLKLTNCPLPWHSSFNLSGVTTLFLSHLYSPSQQNFVEFLTTLGRMQALTVLHLECALPSPSSFLSSGAFSVSPTFTLPCLTRLFVHAPLSTAVALLSFVDIPLKTHVTLIIESENISSINDFAQLPSVIAQRFNKSEDLSSSSLTIRSLIIRFSYQSAFTLIASERDDCGPDLSMSSPLQDCSDLLVIHVAIHIVSDICCSIPSTHIQTLHVMNQPLSPYFWRKTLGHLNGLRHMKLSYGDMPDLGSLLAHPAGVPVGENTTSDHDLTLGHTFLPGLEELELYRITFSPNDNWSCHVITEESLLDALSTRESLHLTKTECDVRVEEDEEDEHDDDDDDDEEEEEDEDEEDEDEDEDEDGSGGCDCNLCLIRYRF